MKLCIIGDKKKNVGLLEEAKKKFDSVLYVPIDNIRLISSGEKITAKYRERDLSDFDCVLVDVPRKKYIYTHLILSNLSEGVFKTQSAKSFLIASNRISLLNKLAESKLNVPKVCLANTSESASRAFDDLDFPVLVRSEERGVMLAYSKKEAKTMIDALQALEKQIFVEEYNPKAQLIDIYVIGNQVAGFVTKKIVGSEFKKAKKRVKLNKKLISTALEIMRVLDTEWAKVSVLNLKNPVVADVSLTPLNELEDDETITLLVDRIRDMTEIQKKGSWFYRTVKESSSLFKDWLK